MPDPAAPGTATDPKLALVLSGGGARAAYQVGTLRFLARARPRLGIPILTGVSAGAINAAFLASRPAGLAEAVERLTSLWRRLEIGHVFATDLPSLGGHVLRWLARLGSGGSALAPEIRGMVDTRPLRSLLDRELRPRDGEIPGIAARLASGSLEACALTAINYSTGQTVTFVEGCDLPMWERPNRISVCTRLTVDHVMPRSRGGETTWSNVVAACLRCNLKKGNRLPEEVGMRLVREPVHPKFIVSMHLFRQPHASSLLDSWRKYLVAVPTPL